MDQKKLHLSVRIWLIIVTIVTGLSLLGTAALFIGGYIIMLAAPREISMFVTPSMAIMLGIIYLIFATIWILPLVFAWKSWKNEKYEKALILSFITIGLIVIPSILLPLLG